MLKGTMGEFIAAGFFGVLFWIFAAAPMYDVLTGYGMDSFQSGLILVIVFLFFVGMLAYGLLKSDK